MRKLGKSRDEILKEVRSRRPKVKPNDNFMVQLKVWEKVGYQIWEDEEKRIPKPEYNAFLERRAVELKAKGLTGDELHYPLNL
jgi:dual specificity phosphatase 12